MHIVNDLGTEMVNGDNVFSFAIGATPEGEFSLRAFSIGTNQAGPIWTALTSGSKGRCEQALAHIRKGIKDRQHIVDLLGLLGQRPDIAVAQPRIVLPGNGDGRS
jgi:hypothetical protein